MLGVGVGGGGGRELDERGDATHNVEQKKLPSLGNLRQEELKHLLGEANNTIAKPTKKDAEIRRTIKQALRVLAPLSTRRNTRLILRSNLIGFTSGSCGERGEHRSTPLSSGIFWNSTIPVCHILPQLLRSTHHDEFSGDEALDLGVHRR